MMDDSGEYVPETTLEETAEQPVAEEKKRRTLGSVLFDVFAVTYYLGSKCVEGGVKGVKGAAKGAQEAKEWVEEYGPDVKRGYQIGADVGGLIDHMDLAGTVRDVFEGNEHAPKEVTEDSPLGVRAAEEYSKRRDSLPAEEQGPVSVATWGIGFLPGVLTYLITWPFKALYHLVSGRYCRRKAETPSGLEEKVEETPAD